MRPPSPLSTSVILSVLVAILLGGHYFGAPYFEGDALEDERAGLAAKGVKVLARELTSFAEVSAGASTAGLGRPRRDRPPSPPSYRHHEPDIATQP